MSKDKRPEKVEMKLLTIGIRGPNGYLRADSQPLDDTVADEQFDVLRNRLAEGGIVELPWIVLRSEDIILIRTTPLG
jgi:hypothetical protein